MSSTFRTKKEVDRHVETIYAKIKGEDCRLLKALSIARLYFSVGDYKSAEEYATKFAAARDSSAAAWELLAQIYELSGASEVKQFEALTKTYQLDPSKHQHLLPKIARLLHDVDESENLCDADRRRYWLNEAGKVAAPASIGQASKGHCGPETPKSATSLQSLRSAALSGSIMKSGPSPARHSSASRQRDEYRQSTSSPMAINGTVDSADCGDADRPRLHLDSSPDRLRRQQDIVDKALESYIVSKVRSHWADAQRDCVQGQQQHQAVVDQMQQNRQAIVDLRIDVKQGLHDLKLEVAKMSHAVCDAITSQQSELTRAVSKIATLSTNMEQCKSAPSRVVQETPTQAASIEQSRPAPEMLTDFETLWTKFLASAMTGEGANTTCSTPQPPDAASFFVPPSMVTPVGQQSVAQAQMATCHPAQWIRKMATSTAWPPQVRKCVSVYNSATALPQQLPKVADPVSQPVDLSASLYKDATLFNDLNQTPTLMPSNEPTGRQNVILPTVPLAPSEPVVKPTDVAKEDGDDDGECDKTGDEYDPRPDFMPIVPLPPEVEKITGEEGEVCLVELRAKLYRFTSDEWKERGIGQIKILKPKDDESRRRRIVMRRDQTFKLCANHHIASGMEAKFRLAAGEKQSKIVTWIAAGGDHADDAVDLNESTKSGTSTNHDMLSARFKSVEDASQFIKVFNEAAAAVAIQPVAVSPAVRAVSTTNTIKSVAQPNTTRVTSTIGPTVVSQPQILTATTASSNIFAPMLSGTCMDQSKEAQKKNIFSNINLKASPLSSFGSSGVFGNAFAKPSTTGPSANIFSDAAKSLPGFGFGSTTQSSGSPFSFGLSLNQSPKQKSATSEDVDEDGGANESTDYDPCPDFKPIVELPDEVEVVTGEEDEAALLDVRAKLFRYTDKEWKERGIGQLKILKQKAGSKIRILMRRDQTLKVCCNHLVRPEMAIEPMKSAANALIWTAPADLYEGEVSHQQFCARFKTADIADQFREAFESAVAASSAIADSVPQPSQVTKEVTAAEFGAKFKPSVANWTCDGCYMLNKSDCLSCPACQSPKPGSAPPPVVAQPVFNFGFKGPSKGGEVAQSGQVGQSDDNGHLSFEAKSLKLDTEADARAVCDAIKDCANLSRLTLSGNTFGIQACCAIGKALTTKSDLKFAMWRDMFTGRLKTEIPPALDGLCQGVMKADARLEELDLSDNAFGPIGVDGLKKILVSPSCFGLKTLKLNNTGLGVTGGKALAALLNDCLDKSDGKLAINTFVLGRSRQENEGAIALASVFKRMSSLQELVMPQNGIYHEGTKALCEALQRHVGLQVLNLNDNSLTELGAQSLALALPSLSCLKVLNLGDCLLRDGGLLALVQSWQKHPQSCASLVELYVDSNEVSATVGLQLIDLVVERMPKLSILSLNDNYFGQAGIKRIVDKLSASGRLNILPGGTIEEEEDGEASGESNEEEEDAENENDDAETKASTPASATAGQNGSAITNIFGQTTKHVTFGQLAKANEAKSSVVSNDTESKVKTTAAPTTTPFIFGNALTNSGSSATPTFGSTAGDQSSGFLFGKPLNGSATVGQPFKFPGFGAPVFGGAKANAGDNAKADDGGEDDADGGGNDHDPHFEPIVPLPDLVEVTTGEEGENIVFAERAKCFRFDNGEWKERGVGDLKILKRSTESADGHCSTVYRVLLRRDQVHKVALNHRLTPDIEINLHASNDKTVNYVVPDFSDGEMRISTVAIRLKTPQLRDEFIKCFKECQAKVETDQTRKEWPVPHAGAVQEAQHGNGNTSGEDVEYDDVEDEYEDERFAAPCRLTAYDTEDGEAIGKAMEFGDVHLRLLQYDELNEVKIKAAPVGQNGDNSASFICDHNISSLTEMATDLDGCSATWSALDFAGTKPVYRQFTAHFQSAATVAEFEEAFVEVHQYLLEADYDEVEHEE